MDTLTRKAHVILGPNRYNTKYFSGLDYCIRLIPLDHTVVYAQALTILVGVHKKSGRSS